MKDFDKVDKDEVKIVSQKQIEKKREFLGSVRPRPNQRCFEINRATGEANEAKYKISATFGNGTKKEIDIQPNCVYVVALNKANALKKYKKSA